MGTISDAVTGGTRTDVLRALRVKVAAEIDGGVAPRDLASLSRQLRDLTAELDALDNGKEPSPLDSFLGDPPRSSGA